MWRCRLLDILARGQRSLAEIRDAMPETFNTPELRFDCSEEQKFEAIRRLKEQLRAEGGEVSEVDGVRVTTAEGWWLLRASNTQAVLVARAEAQSAEALDRLKDEIRRRLTDVGLEPPTTL